MRPILTAVLYSWLVGLTLGCGGGEDDPAGVGGDSFDEAKIAVAAGRSLERIALEAIPDGADPDALRVLIVGGDGIERALSVQRDTSGTYFFFAPLHPETPNAGGDVTVIVTDGSARGPERSLALEPLPASPGAFERLVTSLRAMIDQRAQWAGTDIETLEATPFDAVEPWLIPLRAALGFVDGDEPGDLLSLVEDTAGYMSTDEHELLDRILGYAPLDEIVTAAIDSFARGGAGSAFAIDVVPGRRACIDVGPSITTAQQLSDAMIRSRFADISINPNSRPGRTLEALGTVLAGGGVLPVYGKVFSTIGCGLASYTATTDLLRSIYPSSFASIEFDLDRADFDEDETRPGTWSNVEVVAVSDGWRATKSIANMVISAIGAYVSGVQSLEIQELEILRDVVITGTNTAYGEFLDGREGGLEFCQKTFDVDISGLPWSTAAALERRFDVDTGARQIRPNQTGPDVLRVAAQPSQFGGREIEKDLPLVSRQITVDVDPNDLVVRFLGETINVTGTIDDAQDSRLYWDAEAGAWQDELGTTTPGPAVRSLQTPTNPDFYPFDVKLVSLSRDGLRSTGQPERSDVLTVRANPGIVIEPPYACIAPGESLQFTATVNGPQEYTVLWDITEGYGNIDANGVYTALPLGTSNAVIRARLAEDEEITGEARVDVSACNCSLDIEIDGDATWNRQSSQVAYTVNDFDGLFFQFWMNFDDDGNTLIAASFFGTEDNPAPVPGDTGSWEASFAFSRNGQTWISSWDEDIPIPGVSINITELTASSMVGSFTGNAFQFNEDGDVSSIVGVDVQFRAGLWDGSGGNWPCE